MSDIESERKYNLDDERDHLKAELEQVKTLLANQDYTAGRLRSELQKAKSACALMRGALDGVAKGYTAQFNGAYQEGSRVDKVFKALSTDCGTALLARLKELEGETRFLADSIDRRDDKIRVLDSKLHARDTALAAARVALGMCQRGAMIKGTIDKEATQWLEERDTLIDTTIRQIDAVLPRERK